MESAHLLNGVFGGPHTIRVKAQEAQVRHLAHSGDGHIGLARFEFFGSLHRAEGMVAQPKVHKGLLHRFGLVPCAWWPHRPLSMGVGFDEHLDG